MKDHLTYIRTDDPKWKKELLPKFLKLGLSLDQSQWTKEDAITMIEYLKANNKVFITFLPSTPISNALVLRLFHCKRCGNCCLKLGKPIHLQRGEVGRIADFLRTSKKKIKQKTIVIKPDRYLPIPCPFYDYDNSGCSLHEVKPNACFVYPLMTPMIFDGTPIITLSTRCEASREVCLKLLLAQISHLKFRKAQ